MSYQSLYYAAESNYRNACSQVWNCEENLRSLAVQKQNTTNEINQLNTDIANHETAQGQVKGLTEKDATLLSYVGKCDEKIDDSNSHYTSMSECDYLVKKNVNTVYHTEMNRNSSCKNKVIGLSNENLTKINTKLGTLRSNLTAAQQRYNSICSSITTNRNNLRAWEDAKDRYWRKMLYYEEKMQTEDYY